VCALLEQATNELIHVADREYLTGVVVWDLELELPLDSHNELY
jgi:hypothetical protein